MTVDWAPLALRLSAGPIFMMHGWGKLAGAELSFFQDMLTMGGWEVPETALVLIAVFEFVSGAALVVGALTRLASACLAIQVVVGCVLFHLGDGYFLVNVPSGPLAFGLEYHLALLGSLVSLALMGAGAWSIDGFLQARDTAPTSHAQGERPREAS